MKIGKLLLGPERTNDYYPTYTLAAWCHSCGYWRWAIWWSPPTSIRNAICLPRIGPSRYMGTMYWTGGQFGAWAQLPIVGCFSTSTQPKWVSSEYRKDYT